MPIFCCVVLCCVGLCCVVLCCVVLCCVVLCCVVLCCVVLCCVVLCCVVLCCVVPKALLPQGNGRDVYPWVQVNGRGCVCRVPRRVYVCRPRRGEGEHGRPGRLAFGDRPYSRSSRCTPSRSACWCRRHPAARAQAGLQQRSTLLGVGVPDPYGLLYDVADEFGAQRVGPRTLQVG